jgi:hypothetical protein
VKRADPAERVKRADKQRRGRVFMDFVVKIKALDLAGEMA